MLDSLKMELGKYADSTKAKIAFKIAKFHYYYNTSTDSITHYANLGLKYSREYGFSEGEDRYHFLIGQMHWQNKDYGAALRSFQACEELLAIRKDQRALAIVHNAYGTIYMSLENYEKANEHYIESLKIGEALGLKKDLATTYSNLAIVNTRGRHFRRSLMYNIKALNLLSSDLSKEDSLTLVTALLNTAASYKNMNLIDSARISNLKAIDLAQKMGYSKGIQRSLY
ncbi:MAG: tetratricopeptide repeat protein, partial [Bacteroidota bacterium]